MCVHILYINAYMFLLDSKFSYKQCHYTSSNNREGLYCKKHISFGVWNAAQSLLSIQFITECVYVFGLLWDGLPDLEVSHPAET